MTDQPHSSDEQTQIDLAQNIDDLKMASGREGVKYLTFNISGKIYGSEIDRIKEIIEYGSLTRIPLTPKYLRGVINLRGNVVPVVDLAIRLNKDVKEVTKKTCIIILEMISDDDEVVEIGFVVDEVDKVVDISKDLVTAAPQFGLDIRTDYISCMGKCNDKFVVFLNLDEVLSIEELSSLVDLESKAY